MELSHLFTKRFTVDSLTVRGDHYHICQRFWQQNGLISLFDHVLSVEKQNGSRAMSSTEKPLCVWTVSADFWIPFYHRTFAQEVKNVLLVDTK